MNNIIKHGVNLDSTIITKVYDGRGNLIEELESPPFRGGKGLKFIYEYNEYDDQVSCIYYNLSFNETTVTKWEYQYDPHHNWISQIEYINDKPKDLTRRDILYY